MYLFWNNCSDLMVIQIIINIKHIMYQKDNNFFTLVRCVSVVGSSCLTIVVIAAEELVSTISLGCKASNSVDFAVAGIFLWYTDRQTIWKVRLLVPSSGVPLCALNDQLSEADVYTPHYMPKEWQKQRAYINLYVLIQRICIYNI